VQRISTKRYGLTRFSITVSQSGLSVPAAVAVPLFVAYAARHDVIAASVLIEEALGAAPLRESYSLVLSKRVTKGADAGADSTQTERVGPDYHMAWHPTVRARIAHPDDFPVSIVATSGEGILVASQITESRELPPEFFLKEFLDLDADDYLSLLAFVLRWGPLEIPQWRFGPPAYGRQEQDSGYEGLLQTPSFSSRTDAPLMRSVLSTLDKEGQVSAGISGAALRDEVDGSWHPVALQAYAMSSQRLLVHTFQAAFETWISATPWLTAPGGVPPAPEMESVWRRRGFPQPSDASECVKLAAVLVNDAAAGCGPHVELEVTGDRPANLVWRPRILSAMALQALSFLSEGLPAQRCANERCGRWFVRQRGRSRYDQHRTRGVLYCSAECAKAQAEREYRRRSRAGSPGKRH